jgi:excisionase family DNA binding protein
VTASPWLTAKEAADYVRKEYKYFLVLARKKRIQGHQQCARGEWLFHVDDLDAYVRRQKPKTHRLRAA